MKVSISPMTIEPFNAEPNPICSENSIAIRNSRNKKTVNVQIIILARSNIFNHTQQSRKVLKSQ